SGTTARRCAHHGGDEGRGKDRPEWRRQGPLRGEGGRPGRPLRQVPGRVPVAIGSSPDLAPASEPGFASAAVRVALPPHRANRRRRGPCGQRAEPAGELPWSYRRANRRLWRGALHAEAEAERAGPDHPEYGGERGRTTPPRESDADLPLEGHRRRRGARADLHDPEGEGALPPEEEDRRADASVTGSRVGAWKERVLTRERVRRF